MKILDLFCGAGGAAVGMKRACPEAEIVGIDFVDQPRYPFSLRIANALTYPLEGFDFIWASPPCQAYSVTKNLNYSRNHPALIDAVRSKLSPSGRPWIIENVKGAPLFCAFTLCASSFGLPMWRHRKFEASFLIMCPPCRHDLVRKPLMVFGTGAAAVKYRKPGGGYQRKSRDVAEAREAMGIDWMNRAELSQAVPPAYAEYIMRRFLEVTSV